MSAAPPGEWPKVWHMAVAAGIVLGIVYTLSPLTVWAAAIFVFLVWLIGDGLPEAERRRIRTILVAAILIRVVVIGGVWLTTDHARVPFATFFGDEGYFIRRATWLRNIALGIPIHNADMIYAFDDYSYMHYMYVIAFIEALVGFAPYGLKVLSAAMYLAGVVVSLPAGASRLRQRRCARRARRRAVSTQPVRVVDRGAEGAALFPDRSAGMRRGGRHDADCFDGASDRRGAVSLGRRRGVAVHPRGGPDHRRGWTGRRHPVRLARPRPRAAVVVAMAVAVAVMVAWSRPSTQLRAVQAVRTAATLHWWQVNTPGYSYQTLDTRLYSDKDAIDGMTRGETGRFLVRSAVDYLTVPRPWTIESRAALAFVPELMFWYCMLALLPIGLIAALRRDPVVTMVLAAYAFALAAPVAVSDGNIGTLVRHRGLALPYLIWLSAVGAEALLMYAARATNKAVAWP